VLRSVELAGKVPESENEIQSYSAGFNKALVAVGLAFGIEPKGLIVGKERK